MQFCWQYYSQHIQKETVKTFSCIGKYFLTFGLNWFKQKILNGLYQNWDAKIIILITKRKFWKDKEIEHTEFLIISCQSHYVPKLSHVKTWSEIVDWHLVKSPLWSNTLDIKTLLKMLITPIWKEIICRYLIWFDDNLTGLFGLSWMFYLTVCLNSEVACSCDHI